MTKDIDLPEFERQLSIYGADLSRWDDVDVKAVMVFIEKTPEARAQFDEAMKLDAALAAYTAPAMDEETARRIIESNIRQEENVIETLPLWQRGTMKAAIVFTACVVLLFVMTVIHGPAPIGGAIDDAAVDEILVIAATDIREQQEMQDMIVLLESTEPKTAAPVTDESLQQNIDKLLQEEIKRLETEDIWSSFMGG